MSQLQGIANRLRSLAQDASPLASNVQASARQLTALTRQVDSLSSSGINTAPLVSALQQAQARAVSAAAAAAHVKSEGVAWAARLAQFGGHLHSGSLGEHPAGASESASRTSEVDQAALHDYTGGGFREINQALRGKQPLTSDIQERANAISKAISRLPPYSGMTWRGTTLSTEQANRYLPGGFVREPAFTSTSKAPESAFSGNTRFIVSSRNGKDVSGHSLCPWESEVLFDKGSQFYVVSNQPGPMPGTHVIILREV